MPKCIAYVLLFVNFTTVLQLQAPKALNRLVAIKVYRSNSGLLSYEPDPRKLDICSLQEYAARAVVRYGDQCNNNSAQLTKNHIPLVLQELIVMYERERQNRIRIDNDIKLMLGF